MTKDINVTESELKTELIGEIRNAVQNLAEKQYLAGVQGEPSVYIPLPENKLPKDDDIVCKCIFEIYKLLDSVYKAGQQNKTETTCLMMIG